MDDFGNLPERETLHAADLVGWVPVTVRPQGLIWTQIPPDDLREPFFIDTARRVINERGARIRVTGLAPLLEFATFGGSLEPTAFIFHTSRCGSTLITNALRSLKSAIVHSEPPAISLAILPYLPNVAGWEWGPAGARALRGAVRALAQPSPGARHYFVKLRSADTPLMALFRQVWPSVPILFVFRHPVEVTVANLRDEAASYFGLRDDPRTAARLAGGTSDQVGRMSPQEYSARVLGAFYQAADELAGDRLSLLHYPDINRASIERLLTKLGIQPSAAELANVEESLGMYSKDPARGKFIPDGEQKRATADASLSQIVARYALPSYQKLLERELL